MTTSLLLVGPSVIIKSTNTTTTGTKQKLTPTITTKLHNRHPARTTITPLSSANNIIMSDTTNTKTVTTATPRNSTSDRAILPTSPVSMNGSSHLRRHRPGGMTNTNSNNKSMYMANFNKKNINNTTSNSNSRIGVRMKQHLNQQLLKYNTTTNNNSTATKSTSHLGYHMDSHHHQQQQYDYQKQRWEQMEIYRNEKIKELNHILINSDDERFKELHDNIVLSTKGMITNSSVKEMLLYSLLMSSSTSQTSTPASTDTENHMIDTAMDIIENTTPTTSVTTTTTTTTIQSSDHDDSSSNDDDIIIIKEEFGYNSPIVSSMSSLSTNPNNNAIIPPNIPVISPNVDKYNNNIPMISSSSLYDPADINDDNDDDDDDIIPVHDKDNVHVLLSSVKDHDDNDNDENNNSDDDNDENMSLMDDEDDICSVVSLSD